jgi:serine/threonine protein kinase
MAGKTFRERWEIIRPIAEGGQAYIYQVKDLKTQDDRTYVLKRLKKEKRKERFEREIEAIKSIDSPYVEKIIDFNTIEGDDFYYVMPYCADKTLENILKDLQGDFIRNFRIFEKICEGIKSAHTNKIPIIHRDLKPSNILISENEVPKIIDFGLCFLEDKERITFSQEQVGSRFYIAPECEEGRSDEVGPPTDIYSLGKILYAMISGGKIFPRERQNEDEYNLKNIMPDIRIKYFTQLINECVKEKPKERVQAIDSLLSIIKENIRLLQTNFFLPDYGNEFCRFCGKGKLIKFGTLKGSIFEPASRPGLTEDIVGYQMILWGCSECGVAFLFKDNIYKKFKD